MSELAPRFNSGPYGPGDVVEGAIVATEPLDRLRSVNAYLRYVAKSPSFTSGATHDSLVPLHQGPLAQGQEIPFSFRLPADALPNWEDPKTDGYGTLGWSIVTETDVAAGLDHTITHPIPIDRNGRPWTGPAPSNQPKTRALVDDWDVELEADRHSLRRGEDVTFTVRIGKPKSERPKLEVLFVCQVKYRVEIREPTSSTGEFKNVTRAKILFQEQPPIDPSLPEQSFTVTIPQDLPFSYYEDGVVKFEWFAVAKEKRRFFQSDAGREVYLEVLP
jgi:hypothetical protein